MARHMCEKLTNGRLIKRLVDAAATFKLGGIAFKLELKQRGPQDIDYLLCAVPVATSATSAGIDFAYHAVDDDAYYYLFSSVEVKSKGVQAIANRLSVSYKDSLICCAIRDCAGEIMGEDADYLRIDHKDGVIELHFNKTLRLRRVRLVDLVVDGRVSDSKLRPFLQQLTRKRKYG